MIPITMNLINNIVLLIILLVLANYLSNGSIINVLLKYYEIINSDRAVYGGSNLFNGEEIFSSEEPMQNMDQSVQIVLSPLSITIIKCGD